MIFVSCNSQPINLKEENELLKKKVDSLKVELEKCDMLIKAYEEMPLSI